MSSTTLKTCMACSSETLTGVLDLGMQPLANSFVESINESMDRYPLVLNYCTSCTHCQLSEAVDPTLLFDHYVYVSGTTKTLKDHFNAVAAKISILPNVVNNKSVRILDIGSNDNTFLNVLKDNGFQQLYGVDPASNINQTNSDGLNIFSDYWSSDFVKTQLVPNNYSFDVITGFNVFAHNLNPESFMKSVAEVLAKDGVVILQFPIFESSLEIRDFGQIYHEHINYFNHNSFATLMHRCNFNIIGFNFYKDIHGGTAEFVVSKKSFEHQRVELDDLLLFKNKIYENVTEVDNIIQREYQNGSTIVAYGASAKSSTFFNLSWFKNSDKITAVIDDNPLKVGRFCPGSNIPVVASYYLQDCENIVIIITAHNFKSEIISRLQTAGVRAKIVSYTPEVIEEYI